MKKLTWLPSFAGRWSTAADPLQRSAVELSGIVQRRLADPPPPSRERPRIRPASAHDRQALVEMTLRCSDDTLRSRFHAPVGHLPVSRVTDLLADSGAAAVLVATAGAAVVAVGSLHRRHDGEADMAVLVEDGWQHTGLGHRMTGHLFRAAAAQRVDVVVADVMREPRYLLERLGGLTPDTSVDYDGPVATVRIPVASLAA